MKIRVCIPSYRRPVVKTLRYIPFCAVYVDRSEESLYRIKNPGSEIVAVPDGIQGNISRVRNYIMDREFASGADAVILMDDDYTGLFYWEGPDKAEHLVSAEMFPAFVEKYSILAREFGALYWGVNVNPDAQCYRAMTPFSTRCFCGGPFQAILRGNVCRYDERLPLKEDYDFTLQNLRKYRCILRLNKFFYKVQQSEQAGGCAAIRNIRKEKEQFELLQRKWGKQIVRLDNNDRCHNSVKSKARHFDYNPVLHVPIRGI